MTELEKKVLEAIESRKLVPRPYFLFFAWRSVFWGLAALSIVLGALSVAVLLFAISDYYATGWRVFDNLPLDDVIVSIPVFWLVSLPFFMASAYYGVRHTRRGYRLRPALSLDCAWRPASGSASCFTSCRRGAWSMTFSPRISPPIASRSTCPSILGVGPTKAILAGSADKLIDSTTLRLTDFQHKVWTVDISRTTVSLDNAIVEEGDIAIRGVRTGSSSFRAETIEAFD